MKKNIENKNRLSYSCCCVPATSTYLHQRIQTRYVQIQGNTNTYSQSSFFHTISLWNTTRRCVPTVTWLLQGSSELHPVHLVVSSRVFIILHKQCFYLVPVHPVITVLLTLMALNCSLHAVQYCSVLSWHLFWNTKTSSSEEMVRAVVREVGPGERSETTGLGVGLRRISSVSNLLLTSWRWC